MDSDPSRIVSGLAMLILVIVGYFLPALIATLYERRQFKAIVVLNLLLGWTIAGWVAALIWAFIEDRPER